MVTNVPQKSGSKLPMNKIIIGVVILIIIGIVAWWITTRSGDDSATIVITDFVSSATVPIANVQLGAEADEIRAAINVLKTINLDTRFLDDKRFIDLRETPLVVPDFIQPQRRILELFKPSTVSPEEGEF
ncbi:MAG: hypothetical protein O2794_02675 [bacterium]|nr:hypothetical protein [bacterium]